MALCSRKPKGPQGPHRLVMRDRLANKPTKFPDNYFRTTKYRWYTFVPKNLFEQFHRLANFYFLFSAIVSLFPQVSPVSPIGSVLPLGFVLLVSGIKAAVEDLRRWAEDRRVNAVTYEVFDGDSWKMMASRDISPGDLVRVQDGTMIPADLVALNSAHPHGNCFIETANLDGETNLKQRKIMPLATPVKAEDFYGSVECDPPNPLFYEFSGVATLAPPQEQLASRFEMQSITERRSVPLTEKQLLLRGSVLRNTGSMVGLAVYCGSHTKMFQNLVKSSNKISRLERLLNRCVAGILIAHVVIVLLCALAAGILQNNYGQGLWYVIIPESPAGFGGLSIFTFAVLLSTMIPISLYVTVEIVRIAQVLFMQWDLKMCTNVDDPKLCEPLTVRNSNVNEELGQVAYVFSDKTGTLTRNEMVFHSCSVLGQLCEGGRPGFLRPMIDADGPHAAGVRDFVMCLAVCHTVVPDTRDNDDDIVYEAQSPDEVALAIAARANGIALRERNTIGTDELYTLRAFGELMNVSILEVLPFTSERKRMSVLARFPDGRLRLITKGADDVMLLRINQTHVLDDTREHLNIFSRKGFRTLVVAARDVTEKEAKEWRSKYHAAQETLGQERVQMVAAACEQIEELMDLVGVTAVEDRLQDDVPGTIEYLLEAGLRVWVLTGDKLETAVNISTNCKLLRADMNVIVLDEVTITACEERLSTLLREFVDGRSPDDHRAYGLVVTGASLDFVLSQAMLDRFYRLTQICHSVVCCRTTPLQKASVVRMVKQKAKQVCLAIGDGANDTSMITEAHVGVGIMGHEGTQAARAADYSIGEFRHLRRLLSVHGRYSYVRMATFIQYFFYKNITFTMAQLWFAFFTLFSGVSLFDSFVISVYNVLFTGLPPIIMGVFERDVSERVIETTPRVYRPNIAGDMFTPKTFFVWIAAGLFHSLVIFFFVVGMIYHSPIFASGRAVGIETMGAMIATLATVIVNCNIALSSRFWIHLTHFAIWGSIIVFFLFMFFYNGLLFLSPSFYFAYFHMLESPAWWLMSGVAFVACMAPIFAIKHIRRAYFPRLWMVLQERERVQQKSKSTASLTSPASTPNLRSAQVPLNLTQTQPVESLYSTMPMPPSQVQLLSEGSVRSSSLDVSESISDSAL